MSPPVGSTGCEANAEAGASAWLAGASAGAFATKLRFEGDRDFDVSEHSAAISVGRRFGDALTLRLDGGAIAGGALAGTDAHATVGLGWIASATGAHRFAFAGSAHAFLVLSLTVGVSRARTEATDGAESALTAQDTRLGVAAGPTVAGVFSPYVAARAFGGPVFWNVGGTSVVGSDRHHYTVGLGGSLALGKTLTLSYETMFFGERSASIALGAAIWD